MGSMTVSVPSYLERYLQPQPTPQGMTSYDIVRKAVEFDNPPRIPYSFTRPLISDFFEIVMVRPLFEDQSRQKPATLGQVYYDEWGIGQKVTGRGWDHAVDHPLKNLEKLNRYSFPDLADPGRFKPYEPYIQMAEKMGKYIVAPDPVMMFERMRGLLGFEDLMVAPYAQPDGLELLLDRLADLIIAVIQQWAATGAVHGFMTWDDWGLQTGLQMRIETFRKFYKPRYARIVRAAHAFGMHYIWHNCGQILDMIPDMIELGVDVIQLDQPRLMGHRALADAFKGRICFWNTVDIQWSVGQTITDDDLRLETAEMVHTFYTPQGGFMARQYPQPRDIQLSRERSQVIAQAFLKNGCSL